VGCLAPKIALSAVLWLPGFRLLAIQDAGSVARAEAARARVSFAVGLRSRFQNLKSPVNNTWATARLATVVCPADPVAASGMFVDAIRALNALPESAFTDTNSLLAASSFPALAKLVLAGARGCDPATESQAAGDTIRARIEAARRNANSQVANADGLADSEPDRAAQMVAAGIGAADPEQFDFERLVSVLCKIRSRAPDLADELFADALQLALEPEAPNPGVLQELGRYLFVPKLMANYPDEQGKSDSGTVDGSTLLKLETERHSASPDLIADYIQYSSQTLKDTQAPAREPLVAYALAYQLLAKAKDLQLQNTADLEQLTDRLMLLAGDSVSAIQIYLKDSTAIPLSDVDQGSRNALLLGVVLGQWRARHMDAAREAVTRISDQAARQQLGDLMVYGDAAAALEKKDPDYAMRISPGLPRGMKHAMLYTGMASGTRDSIQAIEYLQLALKEIEPFFPDQQSFLLSAIAAGMWKVDRDRTYSILNQLVASMNAASDQPRRQKFDPTAVRKLFDSEMKGASDGEQIIKGRHALSEVVEVGGGRGSDDRDKTGRRSFPLDLPAVRTFDLNRLMPVLKGADPARLEAIAVGLRDESQRVQALVALAEAMVAGSPKPR